MLSSGQGVNGMLAWSHDGRRVAYRQHGARRRELRPHDRRAGQYLRRAAPGVQRLPEDLVGRGLVARRHQTTHLELRLGQRVAPVRHGHRQRGTHAGQRRRSAGQRLRCALHRGWTRCAAGHQPRQRVRAAAARRPGHRRRGNPHRPHSLGHRKLRAHRRRPLSRLGRECRRRGPVDGARRGQAHRVAAAASGRPHRPHRIRSRRQAPGAVAGESAVAARRVRAGARAQRGGSLHQERGRCRRSAAVRACRVDPLSDLRPGERQAAADSRLRVPTSRHARARTR